MTTAFDVDRMREAYAVPDARDAPDAPDARDAPDAPDAPDRPAGRPWVRVNMVSSLDGAATLGGRSGALGDVEDQRLMSIIRSAADVVLVGSGTIEAEGYGGAAVEATDAAWRASRGRPPQPRFAVVSSRLGLGPRHPFFAEQVARPLVLTTATAPAGRREELAEVADVVECGDERVDLSRGLGALGARGIRSVLCEGGPGLLGALIEADLVDELCMTLSPTLVGGDAGRIATSAGEHPRGMRLAHAIEGERMLFLRYVRGE